MAKGFLSFFFCFFFLLFFKKKNTQMKKKLTSSSLKTMKKVMPKGLHRDREVFLWSQLSLIFFLFFFSYFFFHFLFFDGEKRERDENKKTEEIEEMKPITLSFHFYEMKKKLEKWNENEMNFIFQKKIAFYRRENLAWTKERQRDAVTREIHV